MKKKTILGFGILFLIASAVVGQQIRNVDISNASVSWNQMVEKDSSNVGSFVSPLIYKNEILFTYYKKEINGEQWLQKVNKKDGLITRKLKLKLNKGSVKTFKLWKDKVIVGYAHGWIECLDVNTLKLNWSYDVPGLHPFFSINDSIAIVVRRIGTKPNIDASEIEFLDLSTGLVKSILRVDKKAVEGASPYIHSPILHLKKSGEQVMYFAIENAFKRRVEVDLWAYDISNKKYLWKNSKIDDLTIQIDPPTIFGNNLTIIGKRAMTFDLENGNLVWEAEISKEMHRMTSPLLKNELLFIKGVNSSLACLDLKKQELLWETVKAGGWSERDMKEIEGRLYYAGLEGVMYTVDKSTGDNVKKIVSPLPMSSIGIGGHVWDESEPQIYYMDDFRLISLTF